MWSSMGVFDRAKDVSHLGEPDGDRPYLCMRCETALQVQYHSCPACGFEADRDANAAWNILSRGRSELGVGHSEGTPVETALPTDTTSVSAKRVVEAGSPYLKEPPKAASR